MFKLCSTMMKVAVVGGAVLVVGGLVVGPKRVSNALATFKHKAGEKIDGMLDSQVVLENEIRQIDKDYPKTIADLKFQLKEMEKMVGDLDKKQGEARDLLDLCEADIDVLQGQVEVKESAVGCDANLRCVDFRGRSYTVDEALSRLDQAMSTRDSFKTRIAENREEINFLLGQQADLEQLLAEVEGEYRDFQAEAGKLREEIRIIKRNDKLIELAQNLKDRSNFDTEDWSASVKKLRSDMDKRRIYQQEMLKSLKSRNTGNEYESSLRIRAQSGKKADAPKTAEMPKPVPTDAK